MDCYEQIEFDKAKQEIYDLQQRCDKSEARLEFVIEVVGALSLRLLDTEENVKGIIKIGRGDLRR